MVTGDFWDTTNPLHPQGLFDPDSEIVFPIEITDILDKLNTTYADHEVIADAPLECVSHPYDDGVVSVRIKMADGEPYKLGSSYPFTVRVIGTDGQRDDRTLWLKIREL